MESLLYDILLIAPYVGGFILLIFILRAIVMVGGTELAVVERKYFGKRMPQGRVVAQANEVGVQARTLGPGLHFLIPFLYRAKKYPFTTIAEKEVGIVESI